MVQYLCLLMALLGCRIVFAADEDRFKGGSNDGYDSRALIQTDQSLIGARYRGGSNDGYEENVLTGVTIPKPPPRGTCFSIK